METDETSFSSLDRRCHGRRHPARAVGSSAGGYLRPDRGVGMSTELFGFCGDQRKGHTQIDTFTALQGTAGSRPDSRGTRGGRDAEHVSLRGNRQAISRIDHGDREGSPGAVGRRRSRTEAKGQAGKKLTSENRRHNLAGGDARATKAEAVLEEGFDAGQDFYPALGFVDCLTQGRAARYTVREP